MDIKEILELADEMGIKRVKDPRGMVVKNYMGDYTEYFGSESIFGVANYVFKGNDDDILDKNIALAA